MSALALSLSAGVGRNSVSMMEESARIPRLPMVEQLANALKISPAWLAFGLEGVWEPFEGLRCASLPDRVKEARAVRGLTLREAGRRAGSSAAAIRTVESGTMPTLDTIEDLAKALGVSPAWLAYGLGPMETSTRRRADLEERTTSSTR